MTAFLDWGAGTLFASGALMLLVLAIRAPVRRLLGPRLGYWLWALPAMRMVLPPLPLQGPEALLAEQTSGIGPAFRFIGPASGADAPLDPSWSAIGQTLFALWLAGALLLLATQAIRHFAFCARLRREGADLGAVDGVRLLAADVAGPLSFGVRNRFIVVPRDFALGYSAGERELVLAHELAHHGRGDLVANWASLVVLAAHWWNPIAWLAIRAFRADQEFAVDAHVLASGTPGTLPLYAGVLAKAAGIGALPACNLNARSNLKGRLMALKQKPRSNRRLVVGGVAVALFGGAALAATATPASKPAVATGGQTVTIGVKPDGSGGYALIVDGVTAGPGEPLAGGKTLPTDFWTAGGCDLTPAAKPVAMVIKGSGGVETYTVMCASAAPAPVRTTVAEGLSSLQTLRASVAAQNTPNFPEAERAHALGAIDNSIRDVTATLATLD